MTESQRIRLSAVMDLLHHERVQLLRTLPQSGHEAGDPQISSACQMLLAVGAADRQPHPAGMMGSPRQGSEQ
jgi:hypothetical protein